MYIFADVDNLRGTETGAIRRDRKRFTIKKYCISHDMGKILIYDFAADNCFVPTRWKCVYTTTYGNCCVISKMRAYLVY